MFGLPLAFLNPWILLALLSLPVIWWLLRLTPPRPQEEAFPPTRILARLQEQEETPAQSPWWLTLLRLLMAALVIFAMAGPIFNPQESSIAGNGPLLLVVDDGWASGSDWENRQQTALNIIEEANRAGRPVILQDTSGKQGWAANAISADEAQALIEAAEAAPILPDHAAAAARISDQITAGSVGQIHWLSDGLQREGTAELVNALEVASDNRLIYETRNSQLAAIGKIENQPAQLVGTITRAETQNTANFTLEAYDENGIALLRDSVEIAAGEANAEFTFEQPVELRNQITRLALSEAPNAGAVKLLDANNRRRLVGLVSGEAFDQAQPLLSPLYYISRALEPYSDIRRSDDSNVTAAVPDLINQGVSVIILADVGTIFEEAEKRLADWVEKGGLLVRFGGPRLGAAPEGNLLPVEIRPGDRRLGGALSWETPKPLAPFEPGSPFFGLEAPRDVIVSKQLLALQATGLDEKTWARLEDGTPLVTAEQRGSGQIVLYHVGTDNEWSNLPLSGTFVEMLRRTVNLSNSFANAATSEEEVSLPPLRLLDAMGSFVPPDAVTKPLVLSKTKAPVVTVENPPGFYGTEDGVHALNLFTETPELVALDATATASGFETRNYALGETVEFKDWLLLLAGMLLLLDCLAVLWMSGLARSGLKRLNTAQTASAILMAAAITVLVASFANPALAQSSDQDFDYASALETRLAYVLTGVEEVDRISEAGMRGLSHYLTTRTSLEPGEPIGLDISQDELSFYALIYWPIDPAAELPDDATMARVDAFMKQGGSILFDTRDQISGLLGGTANSPAARTLQQMLSSLDIPPLEPVPSDHVLTKSFYLLDDFPGRYDGGKLWIEASQRREEEEGRPARSGDGVSSIIITSNDFAGAWAVDSDLRPLLPTIPPDPVQRTYAFRSGVNLMMYALTGNYKADQVHLPALLERLGQ